MNLISKFFPRKTVKISVERLKELEYRSFKLDQVIDTMDYLKGMSELECNLELVVKEFLPKEK